MERVLVQKTPVSPAQIRDEVNGDRVGTGV